MKHIIYLTTNKTNNKIYIGVHKTENPNIFDGYLGCGVFANAPKSYMNPKTVFQRAVKKYGVNNFYRTTLHVFDTLEEALNMEASLVDLDFIQRTDTYNMVIGGGMPPNLSKTIYQFDLQGNLIKQWKNQVEVTNFYDCYDDMILNCIKQKRSFLDCYWGHDIEIDVSKYRLSRTKSIYQYNSEGTLLQVFNNVRDAALKLDIDKNRIVNAVNNRTSVDGCYFLTINTSIQEVLEYRKTKKGSKKRVYRYTLDNKFDTEFDSVAEAAKMSGLKKGHSISTAIKKFSTSAGYKWSFIKAEIFPEVALVSEIIPQKVGVYDTNGELIKSFDTVTLCQKEFPSCRRVLRGERKHAHGYTFKYIS